MSPFPGSLLKFDFAQTYDSEYYIFTLFYFLVDFVHSGEATDLPSWDWLSLLARGANLFIYMIPSSVWKSESVLPFSLWPLSLSKSAVYSLIVPKEFKSDSYM